MKRFFALLCVSLLSVSGALAQQISGSTTLTVATTSPVLTRTSGVFYLNGVATYRFGLRAANALESDAVTQSFVKNLDGIKAHGMQTVTVSLQGGATGTANGFNSDGTLNNVYFTRLRSILSATATRNMVVVVTYFHVGTNTLSDSAVLNATRLATDYLIPWRNVWLYVINEPWVGWTGILSTAEGQVQVYNTVKAEDASRITFVSDVSGANDGFSITGSFTSTRGNVLVEYLRQDTYTNPGVFTSAQVTQAQNDAGTTFSNQAYWIWHSAWSQLANVAGFPRYDIGGAGTQADPGVTFIWNTMKSLSGL